MSNIWKLIELKITLFNRLSKSMRASNDSTRVRPYTNYFGEPKSMVLN